MPSPPRSVNDVVQAFQNENVMRTYGMSKYDSAQTFFKYACEVPDGSFVIFASPIIIDYINRHINVEDRKYLLDATFKVVPYTNGNIFKQLLIIHIEYINKVRLNSLISLLS